MSAQEQRAGSGIAIMTNFTPPCAQVLGWRLARKEAEGGGGDRFKTTIYVVQKSTFLLGFIKLWPKAVAVNVVQRWDFDLSQCGWRVREPTLLDPSRNKLVGNYSLYGRGVQKICWLWPQERKHSINSLLGAHGHISCWYCLREGESCAPRPF